jgi:hypothetical protein
MRVTNKHTPYVKRVARAARAHVAGLRDGRHVGVWAGEIPLCKWNCCAVDMSRSDGGSPQRSMEGHTYFFAGL